MNFSIKSCLHYTPNETSFPIDFLSEKEYATLLELGYEITPKKGVLAMETPLFLVILTATAHTKLKKRKVSTIFHLTMCYLSSRILMNLGKVIMHIANACLRLGFFCFEKAIKIDEKIEKSNPPKEK